MINKDLFPGGKRRVLTFSYDDGIGQDIRLMDVFRRHGMKATFNLNGGMMNGASSEWRGAAIRRLTEQEVETAYRGFELALHSYTHPSLAQIPPDLVPAEIVNDRLAIERIAKRPVRGMAYPNGSYSEALIRQLKQLGVAYARTTVSTGKFELPEDFLAWHPTCHHNAGNLMALLDEFLKARWQALPVMYVWGHSYEFDQDDNWEVIERFCERAAGLEDVWYAENMEIVRYVEALERLEVSCDSKLAYNPSAIAVWLSSDREPVCVEPGETKALF